MKNQLSFIKPTSITFIMQFREAHYLLKSNEHGSMSGDDDDSHDSQSYYSLKKDGSNGNTGANKDDVFMFNCADISPQDFISLKLVHSFLPG